jgi:pimeloyl-ACP methyl ester carboxylesterase
VTPRLLGRTQSGDDDTAESRGIPIKRLVLLAVTAPLLRAGAAATTFTVKAASAQRRGVSMFPDVPNPAPSLALAASVALDELMLLSMGLLGSMGSHDDYDRSSSELDDAVRFYESNGWADDAVGYFDVPPPPDEVAITAMQQRRGPIEELRFESAWEPRVGEPGRERWLSFEANRHVYATMLRHDDGPRPWLVCVHGQGMGRRGDFEFFRLRRLHHELGINVLAPALPLHGPRREGARPEQQFVSNIYLVNNTLGLAQSVWDLRRILAWLREHEGATSIGLFGFSLGSYVNSLLSTLDDDLACIVSVVPSGDLAEALRTSEPGLPSKRRAHRALHDERSDIVHRVVSPLTRPCGVVRERRFIIAGQGDRIAVPEGAAQIWRHWDEPAIKWRPRGHVTTAFSADYYDHLVDILRGSGLATV